VLRNRSVLYRMGATSLPGLVGNAAIPRQTNTAPATWLSSETSQAAEGNQAFSQVVMSPKHIGGFTEISRQLNLQAPSVEGVVMADLAASIGVAVDLAGLAGTGGLQPVGIINTAGIGGVTGTTLALAGVLEFQTDLGNALTPNCGYVTTQAVAALLASRQKAAGTSSFLWEGSVLDGVLGGCRAMSSAQMPASTMLFGDFAQVLIGEWGILEIVTDPFSRFKEAIIGIRALYALDIAIRQPSSFSLSTSIT
jgi:HK97 family phage major capsid protein